VSAITTGKEQILDIGVKPNGLKKLLLIRVGQFSRYKMDDCRIGFTFSAGEGEVEIFLFATASNRGLRLTQPITERVQGVLSPRLKRPQHEFKLPPSSYES